jgi:serine/threonine protein kinase
MRAVFIKKQSQSSGSTVNDLEREAEVYRALKGNSSLIQMLHFHPESPNSYLVLEKFGQNLCIFLHGKCAIRQQIMEELDAALSSFHDADYVHCDVKPQNILVDCHDGRVYLKLCDLDSAVRNGGHFQHVDGALKYTEQWVAPEVYFGRGGELRATPAMDVFGFGLIAAVLFDEAVSEHKTVLPRRIENVAAYERCLTDQAALHALMPCQRGKRVQDVVHRMCSLDPASRATLRDVELALGLSRATAIHAQKVALREDYDFLKTAVAEKQAEIITHLQDIKHSLVEMGSKMTLLLENNVELKNMVNTVLDGSFDCPTLFIYLPVAAAK